MKQKVILGMSGGVDSSVAALLLKRQGYEVIGYFMTLRNSVSQCAQEPGVLDDCGPRGETMWPSSIDWKEDEGILRKICKKVGVKELIMADCELGYEKKIIGPMFEDYEKGLTPNPDILCNAVGKFPNMLKIAKERGADYIATGHYARIRKKGGKAELLMGRDKKKDQSYFLCNLGQEVLSKCLFPIGDYTKEEIRKIARKNKFENWNKRGSRGVCYLGKIDMKKFLRERLKEEDGVILDHNGKKVGEHPGAMYFTIGERVRDAKGLKVDSSYRRKFPGRLFIAKKRGNTIVIAPEGHELLKTGKVYVKGFKWSGEKEKIFSKLKARIRHLGELNPGRLSKKNGRWVFEFDKGVVGVAPGQYIVFYKGQRVVACGEMRLV